MERSRTLLVEVGLFFLSGCTGAETSGSVVGEGVPDPRTGKKGGKLCGWLGSHTCGLGSPGQVEIRFRIVRLSRHETA